MKKLLVLVFLLSIPGAYCFAQEKTIGIHGGAGTDITLGIAAGGGVSYLLTEFVGFDLEAAAYLFYSYSVDSYTEGPLDYHYKETTSMFIFAVLANYLFGYKALEPGLFFFTGAGAMAISLDWKIESTDDSTANDTSSGVTGGLLLNLGLGYTFGGGLEGRLQLPVFVVFTGYGGTIFAPMIVLLAGYRF